jgi:hypothetical protein
MRCMSIEAPHGTAVGPGGWGEPAICVGFFKAPLLTPGVLCVLTFSVSCVAQPETASTANSERHYLFYEAEKVFTQREEWLTQNWNNPSGGEWIYGNTERGTPTGTVELPSEGPWYVWIRVWDWLEDRACVLEVNGEISYVCGGVGTSQWVWYHTQAIEDTQFDLRLIGVDAMDAWVDCLAVSNDASWVPPPEMANGQAYVSDAPVERSAQRPAFIWCRGEGEEVVLSACRRTFSMPGDPREAKATVRVGGIGFWKLWLNGEEIARDDGSGSPIPVDLAPHLREGRNALGIELEAGEFLSAVWLEGGIEMPDGWKLNLCTSPAWRSLPEPPVDWREPAFDDSDWESPWARVGQDPFKRPG